MVQEQYVFDDQGGQVVDIIDATEEQKKSKTNLYSFYLDRLSSLSSTSLSNFVFPSMVEQEKLANPTNQEQESFSSMSDSNEDTLSSLEQEEQSIASSNNSIYWVSTEKKVASVVPPESNATHVWCYSGESETRELEDKTQVSVPIWEEIQFDYSQVVGIVSYSNLTEKGKELSVYPSPEDAVRRQVESKFTEQEIRSQDFASSIIGNPYYVQEEGEQAVSTIDAMNALEIEKLAFPLVNNREVGYLNGKDVVEILTDQMVAEITKNEVGDSYGK